MRILILSVLALLPVLVIACSNGGPGGPEEESQADSGGQTLVIGGIPDQDISLLEERFGGIAEYLRNELQIDVEYRPVTSYSSLVTLFANGDVQLSWFGGLTGVQARNATPGARALLQRPRDAEFESVFIAGSGTGINSLEDLVGRTFTFGSESSTSGHLMPRFFLAQAGISPEDDFRGPPSYSGSHDKTWKLVESGSFDAGALNAAVWERAVGDGQVDTAKVRVLQRTDTYYDYHWLSHPGIDDRHGQGVTERIRAALLALEPSAEGEARLLDLFETDRFVDTSNENYAAIEQTARQLDLIR